MDENLGIKYENNDIFEDTVLLSRGVCRRSFCDNSLYLCLILFRLDVSLHVYVMFARKCFLYSTFGCMYLI